MRAILWLTVLCGIALATPARQRRGAGEEQKEKAAEHPGVSSLEAILHKHPILSVPVFVGKMSNMFKRVEFPEKHMGEFLDEAAAVFHDINPEKFKGLASKWHNMKSTVLGTFDTVAINLGLMSLFLYAGHTIGFNETRRCDHLKVLVHAESGVPTMKGLVEGIRKTTDCFIDVLKEASKPGNIDCNSITERQAIDVAFHLVQALHPLKLNGARVLMTVKQLLHIMEANKNKQENQGSSPGGQGQQVTTDKRIVELLRRYLEMKRGHGGHGGGKSGSGKGHEGGKSGGDKGPGDSGSSSGKSSSEDGDNKNAKQEKPAPYPCEVFSKNIKDVIQIVLKNVDRFSNIVEEMDPQVQTDDKLGELKTKWQNAMHLAGNDIDMAMIYLAHIIHRLYLNNDTSEIKEVNLCELKIAKFSGTITDDKDEKQIKDFTDGLVKIVGEDAVCIQEEMDETAKLRSRLGDCKEKVPEDEAMRLIQDSFKHLHQVRMTFARFLQHIERAAQPLVKIFMQPDTKKRELREMETELTQLMKKELAADS